MPGIDVMVAGRRDSVSCRAGEEDHLRALAATVDARAGDAQAALGQMTEARQLLFAALLLADDLQEARAKAAEAAAPSAPLDAEALAARLERLAERLENDGRTA